MNETRSIWLGFDSREVEAFTVARSSILRRLSQPIPVHGVVLADLIDRGLYKRPTRIMVNGGGYRQLTDLRSVSPTYDGAMSTEFAISRFMVLHLARSGWAFFLDGDVLVRADLVELFDQADDSKALMCVQHVHMPSGVTKMDGQKQAAYARKNWSSAMLLNIDHPANKRLSVDDINHLTGRELHQFCWLNDDEIGALDLTWNWLAGESAPIDNPKIVHHTLGSPCLPGYEDAPFADEWREELNRWAR